MAEASMESILKFMGLLPVEEHKKRLKESEQIGDEVKTTIRKLEQEILTVNGESEWFLCKRQPGGKRKGDNANMD